MSKKILIVDDNVNNVRLLKEILSDEGYDISSLNSGFDVLKTANIKKPDIILLDIMMPGMDGFEVVQQLKKDFDISDILIIMITAKTDSENIKKALDLGAFDYIKKPIDDGEVIARVQAAIRFKNHIDQLKNMAMMDGLTGIYNHKLLMELFEKEYLKKVREVKDIHFVMVDVDHFKHVNDSYGHPAGDKVLKEMSEIFIKSLRKSDILGRFGGEEFGLVLSDITRENALMLCERIRSNVEKNTFEVDGRKIKITVSLGICSKSRSDIINYKDMIKNADEALYTAKSEGRNRTVAFE